MSLRISSPCSRSRSLRMVIGCAAVLTTVIPALALKAPATEPSSGGLLAIFRRGGNTPSGPGPANAPRSWDWTTGVPSGATRAELVSPVLPESSCLALLPEWKRPAIQLASAGAAPPSFRITAIQNAPVSDCNQLHLTVSRTQNAGKKITVTFTADAQPRATSVPFEMEPTRLLALSQAVAPQEARLRVTEDGNPWLLIRQDGIRCKLMARVEREHGLLHVALATAVCWGTQVTLPREVRALCNGVSLQCLTAAETLETLYGKQGKVRNRAQPEPSRYSFAATSERADYLLPTNYKRLQQELDQVHPQPQLRSVPALAAIPGIAYPGPALLGDARALSGFLLQRQIYMPGQPERIGWLIFSGEALRKASTLEIVLDLGTGPIRAVFSLPQ